jgi:hypothetical protein
MESPRQLRLAIEDVTSTVLASMSDSRMPTYKVILPMAGGVKDPVIAQEYRKGL